MVFPALKLLTVALRQLSKPMASYMQRRAQNSDTFKNICVGLASKYHGLEQRIIDRFYGRSRVGPLKKLNEAKAIELGATVFGELFIFSIAAIGLGFEYRRGVLKEAAKERELLERLHTLEAQIMQLHAENDRLLHRVFPDERHSRKDVDISLAHEPGWMSWLAQPVTGLFASFQVTDASDKVGNAGEDVHQEHDSPSNPNNGPESDSSIICTSSRSGRTKEEAPYSSVVCAASNDCITSTNTGTATSTTSFHSLRENRSST